MKLLILLMSVLSAVESFAANAFLFTTFKGEHSPMTEQIYFAVSKDGFNWVELNGGEPALVSQIGEKGVRDPFLLRSQNGKKFYLIATDLSINLNGDWKRAVRNGSRSIVVWESTDLTHWTEPRLVPVADAEAGCTWAPEAIYDEDTSSYLVFWASTSMSDDYSKHRIWAARTSDFRTFSKPFIYIEKPSGVIDTTIFREDRKYYRFTKNEQSETISMEVCDKLLGTWKEVPDFSLAKLGGYEGPESFQIEPASGSNPATRCLILDHYAKGQGYQPFITRNLAGGQFTSGEGFHFPFRFRHGSILPISHTEYQQLETAYGKTKK